MKIGIHESGRKWVVLMGASEAGSGLKGIWFVFQELRGRHIVLKLRRILTHTVFLQKIDRADMKEKSWSWKQQLHQINTSFEYKHNYGNQLGGYCSRCGLPKPRVSGSRCKDGEIHHTDTSVPGDQGAPDGATDLDVVFWLDKGGIQWAHVHTCIIPSGKLT